MSKKPILVKLKLKKKDLKKNLYYGPEKIEKGIKKRIQKPSV